MLVQVNRNWNSETMKVGKLLTWDKLADFFVRDEVDFLGGIVV